MWAHSLPVEPSGSAPNIYVTRRTSRRSLAQEQLLEDHLQAQGFVIADHSITSRYDTQVRAFREARIIVGPHGAGMSNMVWASPRAQVLEVRISPTEASPAADRYMLERLYGSPLLQNLSASAGHRYGEITIPSKASGPYGDARDAIGLIDTALGEIS